MPFPERWMQTCLRLPYDQSPGNPHDVFGSSYNQWWVYSNDLPITFDLVILATDLSKWILQYIAPAVDGNGKVPPYYYDADCYLNGSGTVSHFTLPQVAPYTWIWGFGTPGSQQIQLCLRTISTSIKFVRSRRYFGPLIQNWDTNGYLQSPDHDPLFPTDSFGNLCRGLTVGFVSQGIAFQPGMASYRDVAFYPYELVTWTQIARTCKRRCRPIKTIPPSWPGPMPVPS